HSSDREAKEGLEPVEVEKILEGVKRMPVYRWRYKENPGVEHIGPVAQDFTREFEVGVDERSIAAVDADGVLFAAVQALARENERIVRDNERIVRENEDLRRRIEELERRIQGPASGSF
ncbi:MAG: tail fiber domain-containing protein, partial [Kiritimatiellae bacterium]|nr:tail fiber domain-containing protein [Kiritimatiellia bacterium]MDW8459552.1 tail fiber domain-containing protein [Verrucomicrobiota bacterium]